MHACGTSHACGTRAAHNRLSLPQRCVPLLFQWRASECHVISTWSCLSFINFRPGIRIGHSRTEGVFIYFSRDVGFFLDLRTTYTGPGSKKDHHVKFLIYKDVIYLSIITLFILRLCDIGLIMGWYFVRTGTLIVGKAEMLFPDRRNCSLC